MTKSTTKTYISIIILAVIFFTLGCMMSPIHTTNDVVEVTSHIDTSIIEGWDGDFSAGNIKMMSGWLSEPGVITDEIGYQWETDLENIDVNDFLLIWICDNNTPEDPADDYLLKVWVEIHN